MIPRSRPNYTLRDLAAACAHSRARGPLCAEIEQRLADFFMLPRALMTPSGRGALYLLLKALPHSRVVLPAFTCTAVTEAARLANKQVVYVDVRASEINLRPEDATPALNPDSIMVATHQYGEPCDAGGFAAVCAQTGALLVEDIAPALGTRINGRLVGTFGAAAFGSFDTTKLVHAPLKAGFIVFRDAELCTRVEAVAAQELSVMPLAQKIRLLALGAALVSVTSSEQIYRVFHALNFALRGRHTAESAVPAARKTEFYLHQMTEWQAAIALPQVRTLDALIAKRRALYQDIVDALGAMRAITPPAVDQDGEWACVRLSVMTHGDKMAYYKRANAAGLDMGFSFTSYPYGGPHAAALGEHVLNLPYYDRLDERQVRRMIAVLRALDGVDD